MVIGHVKSKVAALQDQNKCLDRPTYSPSNSQDFDAQTDCIIDLDHLDTWQHESTQAPGFDEPKGVIRWVF